MNSRERSSTYTSVITARRTESSDGPKLLSLVDASTEALFGRVNIYNLIEKSVIAITLCDDTDNIMGFAAFSDCPNVEDIDHINWDKWLEKHYNCQDVSALNSLFMHYFVAQSDYTYGCMQEAVRTLFTTATELDNCYLTVNDHIEVDPVLLNIFNYIEPNSDTSTENPISLLGCFRNELMPHLYIRPARIEDSDDLLPIFDQQSAVLRQVYGNFFISELIEASDENLQCLVVEAFGTAVGFMCVAVMDDMELQFLNESYELNFCHGLFEPHKEDEIFSAGDEPYVENVDFETESHQGSNIDRNSTPSRSISHRSIMNNSIDLNDLKIDLKLTDEAFAGNCVDSLTSTHSEDFINNLPQYDVIGSPSPKMSSEPRTPRPQIKDYFVPKYKGKGKAFCIKLFCIDERYQYRSVDFLSEAFDYFPQKDFVILTVPHLVPELPLLQYFLRINPRNSCDLSQELYVFYKGALSKSITVQRADDICQEDIVDFLKDLKDKESIFRDYRLSVNERCDTSGKKVQTYLAKLENHLIGIAILQDEINIEYIRAHYNIEDFIYFNHHSNSEHGQIHHLYLNPLYRHYSKFFLKEILRLSYKTCLYYQIYPSNISNNIDRTMISSLSDFIPISRRRQIDYPIDHLSGNAPFERVLLKRQPYALNHLNKKLMFEYKISINARIVVIGASDTGLSFLETLSFTSHLKFNNLTLVSPRGIVASTAYNESSAHLRLSFDFNEHANISLRTWTHIIYGTMTGIDRKNKFIIVDQKNKVSYDYLIIAAGVQYHIPSLLNSASNRTDYLSNLPENVFTINDDYDEALLSHWTKNKFVETNRCCIIYGSNIDAFCCIQMLLDLGVDDNRIILIEPSSRSLDRNLDDRMTSTFYTHLNHVGIQHHTGYSFLEWICIEDLMLNEIKSVRFVSDDDEIELECGLFITYHEKSVKYETFKALNEAYLVYDGRLVIDHDFHTNDGSILAAGPITKYKRCYYADNSSHCNFNSREVGKDLAKIILSCFDQSFVKPMKELSNQSCLILPYSLPIVCYARLPGEMFYLKIYKPSTKIKKDSFMRKEIKSRVLTTESTDQYPNYFEISINSHGTIECILCISANPIPCYNYICLYGLHEKLLNNLISRYDEGIINDFYTFFQENWCLAIYHDRFTRFREEVMDLISGDNAESDSITQKICNLIDEDPDLDEDQKENLYSEYCSSNAKGSIEKLLLNYLSYNSYHLPMYAKPGIV